MKRVKDSSGIVHFVGVCHKTLCGRITECKDLLDKTLFCMKNTDNPITCPDCAKLYCRIKNAPWNEVDDDALEQGMYDAVETDDENQNDVLQALGK